MIVVTLGVMCGLCGGETGFHLSQMGAHMQCAHMHTGVETYLETQRRGVCGLRQCLSRCTSSLSRCRASCLKRRPSPDYLQLAEYVGLIRDRDTSSSMGLTPDTEVELVSDNPIKEPAISELIAHDVDSVLRGLQNRDAFTQSLICAEISFRHKVMSQMSSQHPLAKSFRNNELILQRQYARCITMIQGMVRKSQTLRRAPRISYEDPQICSYTMTPPIKSLHDQFSDKVNPLQNQCLDIPDLWQQKLSSRRLMNLQSQIDEIASSFLWPMHIKERKLINEYRNFLDRIQERQEYQTQFRNRGYQEDEANDRPSQVISTMKLVLFTIRDSLTISKTSNPQCSLEDVLWGHTPQRQSTLELPNVLLDLD